MKKLQLSLKTKWFEMTKQGVKTEDYREITPYWAKRLLLYQKESLVKALDNSEIEELCITLNNCDNQPDYDDTTDVEYELNNWYLSFKNFSSNKMTLGYPKSTDTERIIEFEHKGIEIGYGKEEWGAEKGKLYFIIQHGIKL